VDLGLKGGTVEIAERAARLRTVLTEDPHSRTLITELLPSDIASAGQDTVVDFSDWSQFDQWPQSY
jgi:hypothetical protein